MLRWRLLLGAILIAALAGLCWLDNRSPGVWLAPVSLIVAVLASGELLWLFRSAGIEARPLVVYAGNLSIVAVSWSGLRGRILGLPDQLGWPSVAFVSWLLFAFVIEIFAYRKPGGVTSRLAATVFALGYVGLLLSFLVLLRGDSPLGIGALLSLIVVVKMRDIGAYTAGRLVGRHKMAPYLSPGKTIEGAIGGIVFACAGAWIVLQWFIPKVLLAGGVCHGGWITFGVIVGTCGMFGDLAESLLKRDLGRKDSSAWLPGFGGVLDIVDSLLFAAPIAYLCWQLGLISFHEIG